jgi:DNA polymerase-3 subunit delta'
MLPIISQILDLDDPVGRQIASGASHHLLHLARPVDEKTGKAKSVITVDEVRKAGKFFGQTSGTGNWRIAIIDPADDLNRNAANAILKILEEPPKRSLFLVLSHTPGRLLPTIRSRCLSLRLQALSPPDLDRALSHLGAAPGRPMLSSGSVKAASRGPAAANYGGVEIAEAFVDILERGSLNDREPIHKLAETLSARDRDVAYHFFTGFVIDRVQAMARDAGGRRSPKPTGWRDSRSSSPNTLPPQPPTISIESRPCCMCSHIFRLGASAEAFEQSRRSGHGVPRLYRL